MHRQAYNEIVRWTNDNRHLIDGKCVADLGSLNINGGVKDIIPSVVGFDICEGKNVDVVIIPNVIPERHIGIYDVVFCVNALNACPDINMFFEEIHQLLRCGGLGFVIFRLGDERIHTTSNNKYGYKWHIIMNAEDVLMAIDKRFEILETKHISETNDFNIIMSKR